MCFVWISEKTAVISLYSINLSVFSSTCFGPQRSIIRSILYKLYSQTLVCGNTSIIRHVQLLQSCKKYIIWSVKFSSHNFHPSCFYSDYIYSTIPPVRPAIPTTRHGVIFTKALSYIRMFHTPDLTASIRRDICVCYRKKRIYSNRVISTAPLTL